MVSDGFKRLINEINECIPSYTADLESLKNLIDFQKEIVKYSLETNPDADLKDLNEQGRLIELNALVIISLLDLSIVCKNLCLVETDWEKIFYIKNGYLIIYETIIAYNKHCPDLRNITADKYKKFKDNFESINIDFRNFKKTNDYQGAIALIRNKVVGHIDSDFELYFNTIKRLDGEKLGWIISQFIQILSRLIDLLKNIGSLQRLNLKNEAKISNELVLEKMKQLELLINKSNSMPTQLSESAHTQLPIRKVAL